MKEKIAKRIAKRIVCSAEKIAYRSVGKSIVFGVYEIKPPKELLNKQGLTKNEYIM